MGKASLLLGVLALACQAQTVTVTATPASLTFTCQSGAATLPAAQTVSVKAGSQAYTTAVAPNTALWLTVSPDSGKLPASLSIRVNPTSLAVGAYNASVVVTVTGAAGPVNIPVTLNVTAPPSTLTVSPATLSFAAPPTPVTTQTLTLSTNGSPISFTATSGAAWMTVSPGVGVVLPGFPETLTVTVDPTNLAPQATPYAGKITVVASGAAVTTKSQNITVNLTLNSAPPTIASVWPATLPVDGGAQTITVRGTNFYSATLAKVQGVTTPLTTTVLSSTALLAVVPATLLTAPGSLSVLVSNPAPGGDSATSAVAVANTPTIFGVVNAASYASATVSPGELVTIFGTNIGPSTPASMTITAGYVDTTLSGVSVKVDGKDAPMVYVSASQVTIQIPYEVAIGAGKTVVLTNGATNANTTVTTAATSPGIFTADGSGSGLAAALNYNTTTGVYTLNGTANPAKIGDTVLIYLTGEGDYNLTPLSGTTNTGYIIPANLSPLPQMSPLPTVTIGGAGATVSYAGPIPGSMLGLLQMNLVVPAGSTTGSAVPVVVTIGANSTQANVTLAIHQ
ncbi:MAG: IPT/TIG domain-containing protein [Acidobacteriia bacterium]|nr:IPT/TIG domain-containing protein [Terriglobia bacterium]